MKILKMKHWQLFIILFGPGIISLAMLQNLLENQHNLFLGLFIMLIVFPIHLYHLMVGRELRKLLNNGTSLNYSVVILSIIVNLIAQALSLNWDLFNDYFLVILILNFGSYTYIILHTLRNTYLLENKLEISAPARAAFFDFIWVWTLPFGIWMFQNRLNKIMKMSSPNNA